MRFRFASSDIRKCVKWALLLMCVFAIWTADAQEADNSQIIEQAIQQQNLGLAYLEESQPSKLSLIHI